MDLNLMKREASAGLTTFLTMVYIVLVNPSILATEGTGMAFDGVLTATVLICASMTLLMGLVAKLPYSVAPGMGLNAFFTYTVILGMQIPWQQALGMVFWSGVLFLIVSLTPLRENIARAIPLHLRSALAVGIGVFLSFIGFKNAGLIQAHPATFVTAGEIGIEQGLALVGMLITLFLMQKKSPLAYLSGIAVVTMAAFLFGKVSFPDKIFSAPDFHSVFLKVDVLGSLKLALLPAIMSIFFTDLFDSISTFVGVSQSAGLVDQNGEPKNLRRGLLVDAIATLSSSLAGTSSGTTYIESAAGIQAGGKTGWTSVFCATYFLPLLFLAPLAGMVPAYATAPVLIIVGMLMFQGLKNIRLDRIEEAMPAFLTIVLIPLSFSITQGILWGFVGHSILFLLVGRSREIKPLMWILSAGSLALIISGV